MSMAIRSTEPLRKWPLSRDAVRYLLPQHVIRELAKNPITSGSYLSAIGYYPKARGHKTSRSVHEDSLLIYCANGVGYFETSSASGEVFPGEILLLPEGNAPHIYGADSRQPWTIYWCHFDGDCVDELARHMLYSPRRPVIPVGLDPLLITYFTRILDSRRSSAGVAAFIHASCILRQLIAFVGRQLLESRRGIRGDFDLQAIQGLMLENLDGRLELETLAKAVNLSKQHFICQYKRHTGIPPITHFIQLKIERACNLLDTTDRSIKQISEALGYQDALYFSRLFTKIIGMSPTQYRREHAGI